MTACHSVRISLYDRTTSRCSSDLLPCRQEFREYPVNDHPQKVCVLDLGPYMLVTVLHKQHLSVPHALLQQMAKNIFVVPLLLFTHDGVKRQFLIGFVYATHSVVVVSVIFVNENEN